MFIIYLKKVGKIELKLARILREIFLVRNRFLWYNYNTKWNNSNIAFYPKKQGYFFTFIMLYLKKVLTKGVRK